MENKHPIIVNIDRTIINTNIYNEIFLLMIRKHPLLFIKMILWIVSGRSSLKAYLSSYLSITPSLLPYNEIFLKWINEQHLLGRRIVLYSSHGEQFTRAIAHHLHLSENIDICTSSCNADTCCPAIFFTQRFGYKGFDYADSSIANRSLWQAAHAAIVLQATPGHVDEIQKVCPVEHVFTKNKISLPTWMRMLRTHQWLKNLLLFVPLFAAHQLNNYRCWLTLSLAFCSFCLCSSSVYIANDLFDLENDRAHPRKRKRPFAAGDVPILAGVVTAPLLFFQSLILGRWLVGGSFFRILLLYGGTTCVYSWFLKRIVLIDCLTLASLYTIRIIAGAEAVAIKLSFWLLDFSIFIFLSLAFIKRYTEMIEYQNKEEQNILGRGYLCSDASLIESMGITSGYAAVVVFSLYLTSDAIFLYHTPWIIWAAVPVILFWINWMWLQAHRGNMHDDPLVFAVRDRASQICAFLFIVILYIGAIDVSW